ncbi:MAG: hypothetical protein AW08_03685 [Candidatus Accumulibacter adjunctus]|uniref:DUF4276 family protein n=1 Tax=Candidatus Accumulibacter adjunctus TaxID=1454001 RepID=A0A011M4C1_9PROT|nr:MAG: hypothetical protein AW08_03685 [Candidatus Accumulibacter adjunctus]
MLEKLIVFVEEYSMEAALQQLLPKLLGDIEFQIIRFQCKDALLKCAPDRLQGYAAWLPESWRILVLVDRDDDDCVVLKSELEGMAAAAGLQTKSAVGQGEGFQVANRVAIEELEAWFFGDWEAVRAAYPRVPATVPEKAGFRDPDAIAGGTWEAMERVLKKAGYFGTGLRKLELARSVAAHMVIQRNRSRSFQAFARAVGAALA